MPLIPAKKYLWNDEFTNAVAAASVNGSPMTPGPGTRTVVDTETCMSVIPNLSAAIATHAGVTFGGSNNRCSYADSFAWADFPTGFNMADHAGQGRILLIGDGTRYVWGYVGAAGSGETLGDELVTNGNMEIGSPPTGWTVYSANTAIASVSDERTGGSGSKSMSVTRIGSDFLAARKSEIVGTGKLFNASGWIKNIDGTNAKLSYYSSSFVLLLSSATITSTSWTEVNGIYLVSPTDGLWIYAFLSSSINSQSVLFDDISVKQVLTPSATGALIYRDAACTVNGWNKPTGFNMNATSYTFSIHEPTSGGKLFFMGGLATPAFSVGLWEDTAITRTPGKIVAFKFRIVDTTTAIEFGLDTDKITNIAGNRLRCNVDGLTIFDGTTEGPKVFTPLDGVEYTMVFILRSAGVLVYLKAGSGYYKYLGETTVNNAATLYAGIANYSAVAYCDFVRLSKRTYLPVPLLSDSFTGDAGTADGRTPDGAGHLETSGLGSGGTDYTWSGSGAVDGSGNLVITPTLGEELNSGDIVVGNWYQITATQANFFYTGCAVGYTFKCATAKTLSADNKVKLITLATTEQLVTLPTTDIEIVAAFTMATGLQVGILIALNVVGTSFIIAYRDGAGNIKLEICEAGTYTTKSTVANTYVAGAEIKLRRTLNPTTGLTELWLYYNNVLQGSGPTTTLSAGENTNLAGLKVGLFSTSDQNKFQRAVVRPAGSNNEYSILDNLVGA